MITLMGITANSKAILLGNVEASIEKVMYSDPRRVGEINIHLVMENKGFTDKDKAILENAALTCPVAKSIHPDIKQEVTFSYTN
jgi:uncharacterized OsmC-like protein